MILLSGSCPEVRYEVSQVKIRIWMTDADGEMHDLEISPSGISAGTLVGVEILLPKSTSSDEETIFLGEPTREPELYRSWKTDRKFPDLVLVNSKTDEILHEFVAD